MKSLPPLYATPSSPTTTRRSKPSIIRRWKKCLRASRVAPDRDDLFVFTYKWFLCGKVDYALRGRAHILCLSPEDPRAYAFFDAQTDWLGKDGILIADERNTPNVERMYANYFVHLTHLADVDVPRGNRSGAKLKVFYCEKLLATIPQPYGKSRQTKFLGTC